MLTGTRDQTLNGRGFESRLIPWKEMPGSKGKCQWMGAIDGARHVNFSGNGPGAEQVTALTVATIDSFLAGVREGKCALPVQTAYMSLKREVTAPGFSHRANAIDKA